MGSVERSEEGPDPGGDACLADATTLCLLDDRFSITADWTTPEGDSGRGMAVELTDATGYFWFFGSDNVEVLIKTLDACTFNDRFWVFAAGLTDVQVALRVEDTLTGEVKTYTNPLSTPFQPVQDTSAFATCP